MDKKGKKYIFIIYYMISMLLFQQVIVVENLFHVNYVEVVYIFAFSQ